ncbi:MAG: MarR family winged helix-turn-helix transcriptional regulator [Planctomycetota bacterium]|jgi:DNA-binding MarR family transcriptional regulator
MGATRSLGLIHDLVGSVQIFASVLDDLMEAQLREIGSPKLTLSQVQLLNVIAATEGMSITAVASLLRVSNAAASKSVDKLVRRRLLRRAEAPSDRRALQLSLTPSGKKLLESFEKAKDRALAEALAGYPPAELRRASNVLDNLSTSIMSTQPQAEEVCFRCGIYFQDKCLMREVAERICSYHLHAHGAGGGGKAVREGVPKS